MTQFKQRIEQGLSGEYTGLANGFERINKYIYNIQRSCYTLIGGLSGSSKTTLCDFILLNGLQDAKAKGIPFNVTYYSWEIDEKSSLSPPCSAPKPHCTFSRSPIRDWPNLPQTSVSALLSSACAKVSECASSMVEQDFRRARQCAFCPATCLLALLLPQRREWA